MQDWLGGVLMERGVERIAAEELTVPPGGDELFSLLALKEHAESGDWDAIIVDCAPTGETLRLLSFPDAARWWLDKVLGRENALLAAARPLARAFLDLSLPDERVVGEIQRLVGQPGRDARAAARRAARLDPAGDDARPDGGGRGDAHLHLPEPVRLPDRRGGREPDVPGAGRRTYFGAWREVQAEQMELVESGFAPVPVLRAPYFEREVLGAEMLDRLAGELFGDGDPAAVLHDRVTQELTLGDEQRRAATRPAVRRAAATCR